MLFANGLFGDAKQDLYSLLRFNGSRFLLIARSKVSRVYFELAQQAV
ncbi:hypothetical protein [Hydrogenophaga sp.]